MHDGPKSGRAVALHPASGRMFDARYSLGDGCLCGGQRVKKQLTFVHGKGMSCWALAGIQKDGTRCLQELLQQPSGVPAMQCQWSGPMGVDTRQASKPIRDPPFPLQVDGIADNYSVAAAGHRLDLVAGPRPHGLVLARLLAGPAAAGTTAAPRLPVAVAPRFSVAAGREDDLVAGRVQELHGNTSSMA